MRIGFQLPVFKWEAGPAELARRFAEIGKAADDAGFASLWAMDHFFQIDMPRMGMAVDDPMLEPGVPAWVRW